MSRFMDLVEANKQRDHEARMSRNRNIFRWVVAGWAILAVKSLLDRRDKDTIIIESD